MLRLLGKLAVIEWKADKIGKILFNDDTRSVATECPSGQHDELQSDKGKLRKGLAQQSWSCILVP